MTPFILFLADDRILRLVRCAVRRIAVSGMVYYGRRGYILLFVV